MNGKKIYAFVCPEEGQGILSIGDSPNHQMPLVFMNKQMGLDLIPEIRNIYGGHGHVVQLAEYELKSVVETVCNGERSELN